jgi:hypothetical protein
VSRFPAKSFLPLKFQLKEKSFCQEPAGLDLDCGRAEAILTKPKFKGTTEDCPGVEESFFQVSASG